MSTVNDFDVIVDGGGASATDATVSATLTPTVAPPPVFVASDNSTITLPDLSRFVPSGESAALLFGARASSTAYAIARTSDGWGVRLTQDTCASTTYAGTAHGCWGSSTIMYPPGWESPLTAIGTGTSIVYSSAASSGTVSAALVGTSTTLWLVWYDSAGDMASGAYQVVASGSGAGGSMLYSTAENTFVAVYQDAAGTSIVAQVLTVSAGTVTAGSATTLSTSTAPSVVTVISLTATSYVAQITDSSAATGVMVAFSVSGSTVTAGTAVALGSVADATAGNACIVPYTSTSYLEVYLTTGGGTSTTRLVNARVCSVASNAITANAAVNTASNTAGDSGVLALIQSSASSFICAVRKSGNSDGEFRGISIAGTTPSFGAAVASTEGNLFNLSFVNARVNATGYICKSLSSNPPWLKYLGALIVGAGYAFAVTVSGNAITVGARPSFSGSSFGTSIDGANLYSATSITLYKLALSGSTLTNVWSTFTNGVARLVPNDTITDLSAYYGSTWYEWNIGSRKINGVLTADAWICSDAAGYPYVGRPIK